jgi:hypothetical protein
MSHENWTVDEAAVRLAEPTELRMALGLRHVADDTTVYRILRRLDKATLEQTLNGGVIRRLVR